MQRNIRLIKHELTNLRGGVAGNFAYQHSKEDGDYQVYQEAFDTAIYESCFPNTVSFLDNEDTVATANKKIKYLIQKCGVDVNAPLEDGQSATAMWELLQFASSISASTIQLLIDNGAKITPSDLGIAINAGKLWAVELLVENGVDVNGIAFKNSVRHPRGIRPLALAIKEGRDRIANYLREHRARE